MSIEIGELAPAFTLYNSEKQQVSLSDYRGKKVLLLFFPFAFSRVCTAELCTVRDDFAQYNELNTVVLGMSVDSLYTLNKYKEVQGLNFQLLSDFNKEVSAAYGCLDEQSGYGMRGVSKRAAILVDENGKIAYTEVLENASEQPDFEAIKQALLKG